jgi:hypothetical protein
MDNKSKKTLNVHKAKEFCNGKYLKQSRWTWDIKDLVLPFLSTGRLRRLLLEESIAPEAIRIAFWEHAKNSLAGNSTGSEGRVKFSKESCRFPRLLLKSANLRKHATD